VYAMAASLVAPEFRAQGFLDTALVSVRYDSGAMATADASFHAAYGYDVRAEVFGSDGMATVGEASPVNLVHHSQAGSSHPRLRRFLDLFGDAYTAELAHFIAVVHGQAQPESTGADGRAALVLALAAIRSVETARPVRTDEVGP
jgi:myo-inositol 2-dehydrogenase / D-chiro-inositol 1-dehydrogenase